MKYIDYTYLVRVFLRQVIEEKWSSVHNTECLLTAGLRPRKETEISAALVYRRTVRRRC